MTAPAPAARRPLIARAWRAASGPATGGGLAGSTRRLAVLFVPLTPAGLLIGWVLGGVLTRAGWI